MARCRTVAWCARGVEVVTSTSGIPAGVVRNDAGRRLGPGLDIRGDGGYVIAPPSRHRSGGQYKVGAAEADYPSFRTGCWASCNAEPQHARSSREWRPTGDTSAWAKAALEGELERLRQAQPGMRNHTLNRVAFRLGQIIAGGQLDEGDIEGVLVRSAKDVGLGEREAVRTVHSGLVAGESMPRGPAGAERRAPALDDGAEIDGP